jgi:large subunit ribosomal protein L22
LSVRAPEGTQEVRAEAKWVRISPRKARLVTDHIRGRSVPEARTVLAFTQRAAAREIEKVLRSAVANAEANHGLFGDDLRVSAAYVDEGPTIKRWRARARGRVARIRKRTCHITIKLAPAPETAERRRRQPAPPAEEAKPKRAPRRKAAAKAEPGARSAAAAEPKAEERKAEEPKAQAEEPNAETEKPKRRTRTTKKKESES